MASKREQAQAGADKQTTLAQQEDTAAVYSREELSEQAEALFGVKAEVVAGAFYGMAQEELTLEEAKQRIQQFLQRKVL